jgi:hypothetical protein
MPNSQGVVGVQNNPDSSNPITVRLGKQGDQIASELHGRYYEQTYRQNVFSVQGAATTTTAGTAATFTGLAVGNPVGSGVNLVINKITITQAAALTASTNIGIMYGPVLAAPITASLTTINNHFAGGAASKAVATAGQTITAPTTWILLSGSGSGAMTVPLLVASVVTDLEGSLIIPPGYFLASYTSAASTTALLFYFQWEEVPI